MAYRERVVDTELASCLNAMGGVLLEGARGCGKTSTGLEHASSSVRLDADEQLRQVAELSPATVLSGPAPRLIDEWQLAPTLWNAARHEIDNRQLRGQFIFSGSAVPADDITRHSGAGRLARLRMRPMTLSETGASTGEVSFADLWNGLEAATGRSHLTYEMLAEHAVTGGWPALLDAGPDGAMLFNRAYLEELAHSDIPRASGVAHSPERVRRLLASLARNVSAEVRPSSLAADVAADGGAVGVDTVRTYLDALTKVFAYEEQPAWSVALRSRSRLRQQAKAHLVDASLALAALNAGPDRLARNPDYFGQIFESMAIRDLRVYAQPLAGRVYHYRDNTGLEIDAVIEATGGTWAALEVKLGSAMIPQAERNLLTLRDERVDATRAGLPAFLAIITGTQYAYTLKSGVHVLPLGVLRA